jgi:hypothetical protein
VLFRTSAFSSCWIVFVIVVDCREGVLQRGGGYL